MFILWIGFDCWVIHVSCGVIEFGVPYLNTLTVQEIILQHLHKYEHGYILLKSDVRKQQN